MAQAKTRGHPSGKSMPGLLAPGWQARAKKTMVYGLLSDAWDAYTAPQRAYRGELDPMSDEAIGNMADLAGMVTLGAGAVPATGKHELRAGIKAYHGSPHDFDKFSMDKIGTGEGAQAYGHGLYFADSEDVARNYRDALTQQNASAAQRSLAASNGDVAKAIEEAQRRVALYTQKANEPGAPEMAHRLLQINKQKLADLEAGAKPLGSMYEVNINASPDDFLDWDKPFASADDVERFAAKFDATDPALRKRLEDFGYVRQQMGQPMPDGNDIIREVMGGIGSTDAARASGVMQEAGIPGIKYLDQGSRAAGDGSRNYVVFDENLISIVKKYGIAGALAAGLLTEEQARAFAEKQQFDQAYTEGRGA